MTNGINTTIYCPLCGSTHNRVISPYHGVSPLFNNLKIYACDACSMMFAAPQPSEKELEEYNAHYFDNAHGGASENKISLAFFRGIARLRYAFVNQYLVKHNTVADTVLEIGPGHGYFAENWLMRRPSTAYYAVESDASCFQSLEATGVHIVHGTPPASDLVVMSHVLEHITQPVSFVQHFTAQLNKGGVLFIEVPCLDWKHKPMIEPHLLFFDKSTMKKLLEKAGFEKIELAYYGKKISSMQQNGFTERWKARIRNQLVKRGITFPFDKKEKGLEELSDVLERVAVAPFKAHAESQEPAWWLRAVATKK